MSGRGHNLPAAELRAFVERIERLEEEANAINADKTEVYAEAKGRGWDTKIVKIVVGRRRQDISERQERDDLIDQYERLLGMGGKASGTKTATRARAREGGGNG